MGHFVDLTGKKYNRLIAIQRVGTAKSGSSIWECVCDCGKHVNVTTSSLCSSHAKSCGCYKSEVKRRQMLGDKQPMRDPGLRAKVAETKRGKLNPMWGKHGTDHPCYGKTGELSTNWKGGIAYLPYCPKFNFAFKERIREKFGRKCFICDMPENGKRHSVHHIDYNKNSICNGNEWAFVPICMKQHNKTNFNRWFWFNLLINYWAIPYLPAGCFDARILV